jgi:NAD(P)H-nitrite reductase large subunit
MQLKAGTNCGSCLPELKRLVAQLGSPGAPMYPGQCRSTPVVNTAS